MNEHNELLDLHKMYGDHCSNCGGRIGFDCDCYQEDDDGQMASDILYSPGDE